MISRHAWPRGRRIRQTDIAADRGSAKSARKVASGAALIPCNARRSTPFTPAPPVRKSFTVSRECFHKCAAVVDAMRREESDLMWPKMARVKDA